MLSSFTFWKRPELRLGITVIVEPDGDAYHAFAPALKGLHVDGRTQQEALENAIDAVKAYLVSLGKHGDPLPVEPDCVVSHSPATYQVPVGAFMRHVTLQWPSLHTSGIS